MPNFPGSGHAALRHGRWSDAAAEYFLTCCTAARKQGLDSIPVTNGLLTQIQRLTDDGTWVARTAVIMPDHIHLLVVLGEQQHLSGAIRLFKGRTASLLRAADLHWERGCFDHRMRMGDDRFPVFRYIFSNPARAFSAQTREQWAGYFCAEQDWKWFGALTNEGCPFPEWLS
jgi:putative transposase